MIHRDIKPQNVIITARGRVKVLDFGIAKIVQEQASDEAQTESALTGPGTVMGTVAYMSPEQARGEVLDARSDIFSFGTVLYEMVTGRHPFQTDSITATISAILLRDPPPITQLRKDAPAELQRIVSRALAKDRAARYQTINDLLTDLRRLGQGQDAPTEEQVATLPIASNKQAVRTDDSTLTIDTPKVMAAQSIGVEAPAMSRVGSSSRKAASRKKILFLLIPILMLALAGIGFGIYKLVGTRKPEASARQMSMTRLPIAGQVREAAVSPDGKYVAYAVNEAEKQSIWVRQVATASNVQVVQPYERAYELGLTFSPDGNYVYYLRRIRKESDVWVLYQVPVLGGASKALMENVDSQITFSPDGRRIAFFRDYRPKQEREDIYIPGSSAVCPGSTKKAALIVANADGTQERELAVRDCPNAFMIHTAPAWSPDGKMIACPIEFLDEKYSPGIRIIGISLEGGTETSLASQNWDFIGGICWLADGSGLVVDARQYEARQSFDLRGQLWQISYPGGEARKITNDYNTYWGISLTSDSKTLLTRIETINIDLWVVRDIKQAAGRQIKIGEKSFFPLSEPAWTPDGRIVYASQAGGRPGIWVVDSDGRNQKQLTVNEQLPGPLSVSPDGRHIVYFSSDTYSIWRMNIDGSNQKELTAGLSPQCSPDGKSVIYVKSDDSGKRSLWKIFIEGGEPAQLIDKGEYGFSISPDGKFIIIFDTGGKLRVLKLKHGHKSSG